MPKSLGSLMIILHTYKTCSEVPNKHVLPKKIVSSSEEAGKLLIKGRSKVEMEIHIHV